MTRIRTVPPLALLACSATLLGGCLFGGGGDDAQQVLDETFANDQQATSGVIDLSVDVSAGSAGSASFGLSGPFQSGDDPTTLPQLDLSATAEATALGQSFNFDGGLVVTEDNAFVEYQGQAYEVGADQFSQVQELLDSAAGQVTTEDEGLTPGETLRQSCETVASQSGGDPAACDIDYSAWVTNVSDEGTEEIDGVATTHVHADIDVEKVLEGFVSLSEASGASGTVAPVLGPDQIQQASDAITAASFDVYSGEEDRILRGLDFELGIDPSSISGASVLGIDSITTTISLRLSGVNEPQTIEPPASAKPIDELLRRLGVDDLGSTLGGLGALGLGGGIPGVGGDGIPSVPGVPTTPGSG